MSKTTKKPTPTVMNFLVDLTDEELKAKGAAMAETKRELNAVKAEKKDVNAGFKIKLDKLEGELTHLSGVIHAKKELRSVDCFWQRDEGRKQMVLVRDDNKQVVDRRPMNDKELQGTLPGVEAPADGVIAEQVAAEGAPAPKKRGRPKKAKAETDLVDPPEQANGAAHADETIPF